MAEALPVVFLDAWLPATLHDGDVDLIDNAVVALIHRGRTSEQRYSALASGLVSARRWPRRG